MAAPTGDQILQAVRAHLGAPYVYGAAGPSTFDCSGLVQYALDSLGIHGVPRTSESQWAWSKLSTVSYSDLQPGDLIFSQWPGDDAPPGHVAVYAGGGQLVEAPRPGVPVHQIALDSSYRSHVMGYKRLTGATGTPDGGAAGSSDTAAGVASGISGIASEIANASSFIGDLLLPATWLRVTCFVLGAAAAGVGVWFLMAEAGRG